MSDSRGSDLSRGLLHRLAVSAAAASVLAFAPVAFGQQTLDNAALAAGFRVDRITLQNLTLPGSSVAEFLAAIVLDGQPVTLDLERHSMRSPRFRVRVDDGTGSLRTVVPPPVTTYRGRILERPGSVVAASLVRGQLTASVALVDGTNWQIQPCQVVDHDAPPGAHVIFDPADSWLDGSRCGTEDPEPVGFPSVSAGSAPTYDLAEIAFDADHPFFVLNNSSILETIADIENVMNAVEAIYEEQVRVTYEITEIIVRVTDPDPYTTSGASSLLQQFRSQWNSDHQDIHRDIAHLMTGTNLDGSTIGIASLSVICSGSSGYGLSQSRYTSNFARRVALTAHELGHNWSATHCNGQSDCSIMCSGLGGCTGVITSFGGSATGQIVSYRDAVGCLSPLDGAEFEAPAALPICGQTKLLGTDIGGDNAVGAAVAATDGRVIVGSPSGEGDVGNSGSAHVYYFDGNGWVHDQKLDAADGESGDLFGSAVDIDGDVVVIGAFGEDTVCHKEPECFSGTAYIFRNSDFTWDEEIKLLPVEVQAGDHFGHAVAVDGDVVVVGAYRNDGLGEDSGAAYIFEYDGSDWELDVVLSAPDGEAGDYFGFDVAIDGDYILIGAPGDDLTVGGEDAGSVWVFRYTGSSWVNGGKLSASDAAPFDAFGTSLDVHDDLAAIGAPAGAGIQTESGAAYVFERSGTVWTESEKLFADDGQTGDLFGVSVSARDGLVFIGAEQADAIGATYIFTADGGAWTEQRRLLSSNGETGDGFGVAVAHDGATALVGALGNDALTEDGGLAYVFDLGLTDPADCNGNGICDELDLEEDTSSDCNLNGIPDECDVAAGTSPDCDGNGQPDECEVLTVIEVDSGELAPIGLGVAQVFSLPQALTAIDDVELIITASADLDDPFEVIAVSINGTVVGAVFQTGTGYCSSPPDEAVLIIPPEIFNEAIAGAEEVIITMAGSGSMDLEACDQISFVRMQLSYVHQPPTDLDGSGTPDVCECLTDLDGSGEVDFADLLAVISSWGTCPVKGVCPADFDGNGEVGFADLLALLSGWGLCT